MWDAPKAKFRENFIALNLYVGKTRRMVEKQQSNLLQENRTSIANSTEERRKKIIKVKYSRIY